MRFSSHFETDPGRVRELNEDSGRIVTPSDEAILTTRGELLVVADGMGGAKSGEVASQQAVETITEAYYRLPGEPAEALRGAIEEANRVIFQRAQAEGRQGMGTTVVATARVGDTLIAAHVGDSRIYLLRDSEIRPLTRDHSLVAEQVAAGVLTPEQATRHPHRNVISRAVGTRPSVEVELSGETPLTLQEGDVVVLCSDGLTEHVPPERILQLSAPLPLADAARALVAEANAGGGSDNISVILSRVGEEPVPAITQPLPASETTPTARHPLPGVTVARRQGGGRGFIPWLLLLLLGGGGVAAALWFLPGLLSGGGAAPATVTLTATTTVTATPTRRPTATPRLTATVPTTPGLLTPTPATTTPLAPAPDGVDADAPSVALLSPAAEASIDATNVTFRVRLANPQPGTEVRLLLGVEPNSLLPVPQPFTQQGAEWELTLTESPVPYGTMFWTVETTAIGMEGTPVQLPPPSARQLLWLPPR